MTLKNIVLILIATVVAAFAVFKFVGHDAPTLTNDQPEMATEQKDTPLSESQIARRNLEEVLSRKRKEPDYQNYEAHTRYWNLTQKWLADLSLSDCIGLIEFCETPRRYHNLLDRLYERYGELDHKSAFDRIDKDNTRDASLKSAQISYVIIGWGQVQPAEAWAYTTDLDKEKVLRENNYRDIASEIFGSWVKLDPDQAHQHLLKTEGDSFSAGSAAYYYGLPQTADFRKEASKMEDAIKNQRYFSGNEINHYGVQWSELVMASSQFASSWASVDADAAIAWWLKVSTDSDEMKAHSEWRAYRLGFLVASWAGFHIPHDPDPAIRWLSANLDILQSDEFQRIALPSLAKHRPKETMELIRKIELIDQQASLVAQLVSSPPPFLGKYGLFQIAAVVEPDIVESVLDTFSFDVDQRKRVINAIRERRNYEANQPVPPPSDW
jgi:hypothetical protein